MPRGCINVDILILLIQYFGQARPVPATITPSWCSGLIKGYVSDVIKNCRSWRVRNRILHQRRGALNLEFGWLVSKSPLLATLNVYLTLARTRVKISLIPEFSFKSLEAYKYSSWSTSDWSYWSNGCRLVHSLNCLLPLKKSSWVQHNSDFQMYCLSAVN